MVLEEGQRRLGFQHVDQREFSLDLINPQMHRGRLEVVFKNRAIMQEGVQAWSIFSARRRGAMFRWRCSMDRRRKCGRRRHGCEDECGATRLFLLVWGTKKLLHSRAVGVSVGTV